MMLLLCLATACGEKSKEKKEGTFEETKAPHIVFVTGEEEYRSEETFPMLAKLAKRELGAKVTVVYSVDSLGFIDPNRRDHIAGLEALNTADLMVVFMRFRNLPEQEREYITNYVESGKPIVGFRTSTHAFKYENDSTLTEFNAAWPAKVFGQQWITHHGHFDDGKFPVTNVTIKGDQATNPILNGFSEFEAYSWLYHVDGGNWKLQGDSEPFLMGHSTKSQHEMNGKLEEFSLDNPVAWTKSYTGTSGKKARVFFTTLGHPYDFKLTPMRKLAMNGMYWALGKEDDIPKDGVNVTLDEPFLPNNSGFGQKFKKNQKPITNF
ncbi:Type 1 glutamine amidotransferase (GATase1) [Maribacter ulvicola]|uniref:Type 1 glutamine amidotransferase (GATase1) n=2 Tax=Maribacter ulvicola TaxID=228959 RepID=A0A1N6VU70_9FLAO|nr:Type 1 glutamine amidotransferase (GATase1) [Maribacter ulvicola]